MRVDVEEVLNIKRRLLDINSVPLDKIEWYEDNHPLDIPEVAINEWKYIGLNNAEFVTYVIYPDFNYNPATGSKTFLTGNRNNDIRPHE